MAAAEQEPPREHGIRIPDDARALEPDRRAYYAELAGRARAERAAARRGPLGRLPVVPRHRILLAVVLAFGALAAGIVVVFTPRPAAVVPALPLADATASGVPEGAPGTLLPDVEVLVAGTPRALRTLRPAALLVTPAGGCDATCRGTVLAAAAAAREYRFGVAVVVPPDRQEDAEAGARTWAAGIPVVVDPSAALAEAVAPSGVTAVLVHADGIVGSVQRDLGPGDDITLALSRLSQPGTR